MHLAAAGDRAVLIELGEVTAAELHAAARHVRSLARVEQVIPGHSSLYVIWSGEGLPGGLHGPFPPPDPSSRRAPRRIAVTFDGEDLGELLALHRLSRDAFLARVQTLTLTARYLGFRGGFAYLDGWPEEWAMPRRATSRPVRRGSFAIAGSVAGFYPIDTPGGWNVLGRTDEDLEHAIEAGEALTLNAEHGTRHDAPARVPRSDVSPSARYELLHSPLVTRTVVPFDDVLGTLALRAVAGNVELLECPIAGPRIRFLADAVVAWGDTSITVQHVRAGEELAFGRVEGGLRGYLAIGDREGTRSTLERSGRLVIHAIRGPHDVGLTDVECEVTPQLDRVGIRLRPLAPLRVAIPADLRSIGMQCGTVQLHPDGSLVAMGPDHPVTGGYLQPVTVISSERWKLAQLRPGERVLLKAQPPNW